jgi:hypothetical protein
VVLVLVLVFVSNVLGAIRFFSFSRPGSTRAFTVWDALVVSDFVRHARAQSFSVVTMGFLHGGATSDNPSLSVAVGDTLTFSVNAPGHLFAIHIKCGQPGGTPWTLGVSGQPASSGTVTFVIPARFVCDFVLSVRDSRRNDRIHFHFRDKNSDDSTSNNSVNDDNNTSYYYLNDKNSTCNFYVTTTPSAYSQRSKLQRCECSCDVFMGENRCRGFSYRECELFC